MGTVLLPKGWRTGRTIDLIVSVPFSMGTVLLLSLIHGDLTSNRTVNCVSVPFSMGTVLLRIVYATAVSPFDAAPWRSFRFSPLLDGDGVASHP